MTDPDNSVLALSFGQKAAEYERGRPDYPPEAVTWMLAGVGSAPLRVADVGAGTGKLTRVIRTHGHDVTAVDPDKTMLAALRDAVPGVAAVEGMGERLPFDDGSLDAVLFGQSWHWVEPVAGAREAARVLRPGGVLGLVWNIRDSSVEWVAELGRVMGGSNAERLLDSAGVRIGEPFGDLEWRHIPWVRHTTVEEICDMAASRSGIIALDEADRDHVLAAVREMVSAHVVDSVVDLPYVTHTVRAVRP